MSIRGIREIIIHFQSFRNIELWYQGMYFLKAQVYMERNNQLIYAHPFAHTENYHPFQQSRRYYDSQISRTAYIQDQTSTFCSKMFLLKYFQQEVDLNDICHFRIETDLGENDLECIIKIELMFFDFVGKKYQKPQQLAIKQAKPVKTKEYRVKIPRKGLHEFCPVLFDQQYFSLMNMCVHSVCLDYRFRLSKIQLFEFSRLSYQDKLKLIEQNKKVEQKSISFYKNIIKQLKLSNNRQSLDEIQSMLVGHMKKTYQTLLQIYSDTFSKIVTEYQKKTFAQYLVYPKNLNLCEEQQNFTIVSKQDRLFAKYKSRNPQEIVQNMMNEVNMISAQLMKLWHSYIDLLKINPRFSVALLQKQYLSKQAQFWKKLIYVNRLKVNDLCISHKEHQKLQEEHLLNQKSKITHLCNIEELNFQIRKENLPFLIENIYELESMSPTLRKPIYQDYQEGIHLLVFVHGFQGSSFDMRLIKNYISFLYPQSMFLCSSANEQLTDSDIFDMGERLAKEVKAFIAENFPNNTLQKISFIGHSLGGLKIRAALPHLLQYKNKFHIYISFSSPHLGYGLNTSSVIQAGIWVLKKMKNSQCLQQLTMSDSTIPEQTCLYRLSQLQGLQHFKHIFFFSSKQDSYAPYQSSRIQIDLSFIEDETKQIYCKMVRNILRNIKSRVLRRISVVFKIEQKNLDSLIGRTAHIMFLESHELMKAILFTEPDIFA